MINFVFHRFQRKPARRLRRARRTFVVNVEGCATDNIDHWTTVQVVEFLCMRHAIGIEVLFFQFQKRSFERIAPRIQRFKLLTKAIHFSKGQRTDSSVSGTRQFSSLCGPPAQGTSPPCSVETIIALSVSMAAICPPRSRTACSNMAQSRCEPPVTSELIMGQENSEGCSQSLAPEVR